MPTAEERYIPALGYRWLTALYDPVVRLTTREAVFKPALLAQAGIASGERVLDLACGTATLTIAAKQLQPQAQITGVDSDQDILARARRKAGLAGVAIQFDHGLSQALPYAGASFDKVICSLFFHHLSCDTKLATLRELRRVLRPSGELHVADWGEARSALMRVAFLGIQLLDGFDTTADNLRGRLPEFMTQSGFAAVAETQRYSTMFGTMSLYRAVKPAMA